MRIAVVGSGISGNLVARLLAIQHDVEVFEANDHIGGHAQTVDFTAFGQHFRADTGFMVFNHRTYPNFTRLLSLLGVAAQDSDMSFSVRCDRTHLEYQGSSLNGLFAQRKNLFRSRFHRMLADILRFNRLARRAVEQGELGHDRTLGEFLHACGLGPMFFEQYLVPMAAAIWSAQPTRILGFPAKFFLGFCHNHGLLQIFNRPQWKTIRGGSRTYVTALTEPIRDRIHLNCPVESVIRSADRVTVVTRQGCDDFDQVVFATHADQTLRLLQAPNEREQSILRGFPYQRNEAVLHTDASLLPQRKAAWASWNYHMAQDANADVTVTYDLNRLQRLGAPRPILLTLNRTADIDPALVLRRLTYHHPAYSTDSIRAQAQCHEINGQQRTYFCGAYWGYGFHEDGVNSALAVAQHFGLTLDDMRSEPIRQLGQPDSHNSRVLSALTK